MPAPTPPTQPGWREHWDRDQLGRYDIDGTQLAEAIWLAAHWSEPATAEESAVTDAAEATAAPGAAVPPTPAVAEVTAPEAAQPLLVPRPVAPTTGSSRRRPAQQRWMIGSGQTTGYPPAGGGGEAGQTSLFTVGHRGDRADLFRTLRPLKRFCSAPRDEELDERRTAEASADAGALVLSFRRREERWLELAVLIDVSASMALWREAAEEVLHVLTRLGAFRDVLAWSFDSDEPEPRFRPFRRRADSGPGGTSTAESLTRSPGPRAFLVISDGVGQAWRQPTMADTLGQLARGGLVSLVNPLPHRMWHRSGIRTLPMYQRVTGTKDKLAVRHSWAPWSAPDVRQWLPVWCLDADELGVWARLIAGVSDREKAGQSMELRAYDEAEPQAAVSPADRVARFRASASSAAFLLATRLAAAPVSLPVMRLVHEAVTSAAGTELLAEILLSGLLVRKSPRVPREDPDQVIYDFARGVREQLLGLLTRTEVLAALSTLASAPDPVARVFGGTLNVRLLTDVSGAARPLPEQAKYFAGVAVTVLDSLGPAYENLAGRIAARLEHAADGFRLIRDGRFAPLPSTITIVQVDGPARLTGDGAALADLLADRIEADPQARPDLLVACEDLVAAATTDEVARSWVFFDRLLSRFQLASDRLLLAPAPVGWQGWGAYEYARAVAGRSATALLEEALGCLDHGPDTWWRLDLADCEVSVTVLDSTQVTFPARFGSLGERQLAWLDARESAPDDAARLRVVIMHHDPASRLQDASAFYRVVPEPDLLLHGWGPSASATSLASRYVSAPAVPDPESGYVVYRVEGRQVAIRGREVLPVAASGRSITSSIAFASRPAPPASALASGKLAEDQRVVPILDPYTPHYVVKTAEYIAQGPGR